MSDPIKTSTVDFYVKNEKQLPSDKEYTNEKSISGSEISHPVVYIHKIKQPSAVHKKVSPRHYQRSLRQMRQILLTIPIY